MKYLPALFVLLAACAPKLDLDPKAPGAIFVQITGADGAAFDQIGQVTLAPNGAMTCTMIYPPLLLADDKTETVTQDFMIDGLYQTLANYIRTNDSPGPATSFEDIIILNDPITPVAILPDEGVFGLTDVRAQDVVTLINTATSGQCLIFG